MKPVHPPHEGVPPGDPPLVRQPFARFLLFVAALACGCGSQSTPRPESVRVDRVRAIKSLALSLQQPSTQNTASLTAKLSLLKEHLIGTPAASHEVKQTLEHMNETVVKLQELLSASPSPSPSSRKDIGALVQLLNEKARTLPGDVAREN